MLRPSTFVAGLFVMAVSCVVISLSDRSWGWLAGSIVLFAVALFARRLKTTEQQEESHAGPRLGFVAIAMLLMVAAIYAMYWLSTAA